jgi:hypothetical protein
MIQTPGNVIEELAEIRARSEKGVGILFDLERQHALAELEVDRIEAQTILDAQGTVIDRQAISKLASHSQREVAALLRVQVNRAKAQLRQLSEATGAIQTSARMVELEWRVGGTGK